KDIFSRKKLYIKDDSTLKQREYLSKLRDELNSRLDRGEKDLTIKFIKGIPSIISKSKSKN
ncbi:hypothetical protein, partial [Enterobacter cloacae complex sp. CH23B]|uniref:hypothetical protein n=1 Tax=Enterobacter cloacae complex sp. CH23B TaxID=2511986 RepID=UPI001CA56CBF